MHITQRTLANYSCKGHSHSLAASGCLSNSVTKIACFSSPSTDWGQGREPLPSDVDLTIIIHALVTSYCNALCMGPHFVNLEP